MHLCKSLIVSLESALFEVNLWISPTKKSRTVHIRDLQERTMVVPGTALFGSGFSRVTWESFHWLSHRMDWTNSQELECSNKVDGGSKAHGLTLALKSDHLWSHAMWVLNPPLLAMCGIFSGYLIFRSLMFFFWIKEMIVPTW